MTIPDPELEDAAHIAAARAVAAYADAAHLTLTAEQREQFAAAAIDAARPFLVEAVRVEDAVRAATEHSDPWRRRPRPTPASLWRQAGGDRGAYLTLMRKFGYLPAAVERDLDDPERKADQA